MFEPEAELNEHRARRLADEVDVAFERAVAKAKQDAKALSSRHVAQPHTPSNFKVIIPVWHAVSVNAPDEREARVVARTELERTLADGQIISPDVFGWAVIRVDAPTPSVAESIRKTVFAPRSLTFVVLMALIFGLPVAIGVLLTAFGGHGPWVFRLAWVWIGVLVFVLVWFFHQITKDCAYANRVMGK
jgi:hypothetical protein